MDDYEDFVDEYFEYDMVMNDGKEFFPDDEHETADQMRGGGTKPSRNNSKRKGGGCLTTISVIALVVVLMAMLFGCGDIAEDDDVAADLYGPYEVVKVVDGDTIRINLDGTETKVRMIGINTPESVHADESKNCEEGREASEYVKDLLSGESVYLQYDLKTSDKYDRTLAYVYLDDKETMVEVLLLENGLATVMFDEDNGLYKDYFYELQDAARDSGAGFWGSGYYN